jgi:hypothetical protein
LTFVPAETARLSGGVAKLARRQAGLASDGGSAVEPGAPRVSVAQHATLGCGEEQVVCRAVARVHAEIIDEEAREVIHRAS